MSLRLEYDKNSGQTILLTLSESLTGDTKLSGLSFYFVFIYDQNKEKLTKTLTDISLIPDIVNEFTITTSLTITGSTNIPFKNGWYNYNTYDSDLMDNLLEIGQCYIYKNTESLGGYTPDDFGVYTGY